MKRLICVMGVAMLATGCEMKGGDPVVTTTGRVPNPTVSTVAVNLRWAAPTTGGLIQGYKVEGSTDGTNFKELGIVSGAATGTTVNASGSGTFYFRIRAFNQGGNSGYTVVASVNL